ncbi:hypothetical protein HY641_04085 [Candidatus Woesearchaeota archaeon]|nr:hypothetical protein [Candidatus Woesearchaeota archaeon]
MTLASRDRHPDAKRLCDFIQQQRIRPKVPIYALFEITAAARQEKIRAVSQKKSLKGNQALTEGSPLVIDYVPMDMGFFNKYFDPSIPYLKAGDLVFVAMARGDDAILVTEDNNQYKAAKASGVKVYRIKEFIDTFVDVAAPN